MGERRKEIHLYLVISGHVCQTCPELSTCFAVNENVSLLNFLGGWAHILIDCWKILTVAVHWGEEKSSVKGNKTPENYILCHPVLNVAIHSCVKQMQNIQQQ